VFIGVGRWVALVCREWLKEEEVSKGTYKFEGWGYHVVAGVARCCSNGGSLVC
jgi:hypothetical protein